MPPGTGGAEGLYNLSMSLLGRGLVWTHLVVFGATISCALACPQFEVSEAASCSEPQSSSCCTHPIEGKCLECVDTNFFEASKHTTLAAPLPSDYTRVNLTENNLPEPPFQSASFVLAKSIFLTNSAFLI